VNLREFFKGEVRRTPLLRGWVNRVDAAIWRI
jgi:hypothetical protein